MIVSIVAQVIWVRSIEFTLQRGNVVIGSKVYFNVISSDDGRVVDECNLGLGVQQIYSDTKTAYAYILLRQDIPSQTQSLQNHL